MTDDDHGVAAITAWSLVHGLAALLIEGPLVSLMSDQQRIYTLAVLVTNRLEII